MHAGHQLTRKVRELLEASHGPGNKTKLYHFVFLFVCLFLGVLGYAKDPLIANLNVGLSTTKMQSQYLLAIVAAFHLFTL